MVRFVSRFYSFGFGIIGSKNETEEDRREIERKGNQVEHQYLVFNGNAQFHL